MQDFRFTTLLVLALFAPDLLAAQNDDLKLSISLNADSSEYDGKGAIVAFRGLRLTQGSIGIEADDGFPEGLGINLHIAATPPL